MAKTKKTPRKSDAKGKLPPTKKQPSIWGTAAKVAFHRPPELPARTDDTCGNPSYLGM